ncbi:MAG: cyclic nucleotide-binding domain-containing protein [Gemmatimonadetes bacterium]|nr:cyclic nucleotide-binding domain-containing protein [Gemmatimonadota bacterium]
MFAVMAAFLFLNTANTTVLSAAKNGLFLSVYEAELIPHAVIAAALLTAFVAVLFTGVVAGTQRRVLATGLTAVLALSVMASRTLFEVNHRTAFVVFLWLSAVQVLLLMHAWDYAGGMLTGRQAKRLLPLIGVGASLGAIVGGTGVAPAALRLGTSNLLWISVGLILAALPLLWMVDEPTKEIEEPRSEKSAWIAFVTRSGQGLRSVGSNSLLRLLALGLIALTITGTLIDLQLKFALQEAYPRDRITAIYGLMSAAVGAGTLVLQLWASRMLFPRFGVSFAATLQGGTLALAAGGVAVFGGLAMLVVAQALDDILQFSLQKPVEQVSLLPFPGRVKSIVLATLGGVLRPLSKATAGGIALALADKQHLLPLATLITALAAVAVYTRHRGRYMLALEGALARHAVDFSEPMHTPLVVDKSTLTIIDRALADTEPTVVIFAATMLDQLPAEDALPRLATLLGHEVPEVRAEAASVFGRIDAPLDFAAGMSVAGRLAEEEVPYVLAALLESVGKVGGIAPRTLVRFLDHEDHDVRRATLVTLSRLGWNEAELRLTTMLAGDDSGDRVLACNAVGDLGLTGFMGGVSAVIEDPEARPAALEALAKLGPIAVPLLAAVLERRELPLPLRRTVITALASIEGDQARQTLLALVNEPMLGPAALHSLGRMRAAGTIPPVDPEQLRLVMKEEMQNAFLLAATATVIRSRSEGPSDSFIAAELQGLQERSVYRVLKVLALSYDSARINTISAALISDNPARRSNALELLEGTISGPSSMMVMPFMDIVTDGMPLHRVIEFLPDAKTVQKNPGEALLALVDWWPRALALHYMERDDEITTPGRSKDDEFEDEDMMPLIEKVMILKGSEFFKNFPGGDLAGIAALAGVEHVQKGEVVFEQGDEGDAFYMVVSGSILISRGATSLATLGPREGFGEMAILDKESRSASATAVEDTTLLSLDRDSFDRVVEQNPVVARGVYRVLTERLRNTLAQVAAG